MKEKVAANNSRAHDAGSQSSICLTRGCWMDGAPSCGAAGGARCCGLNAWRMPRYAGRNRLPMLRPKHFITALIMLCLTMPEALHYLPVCQRPGSCAFSPAQTLNLPLYPAAHLVTCTCTARLLCWPSPAGTKAISPSFHMF